MTLLEIMVVMAVIGLVMAIAVPAVSNVLHIQQVGAARELAQTYRFLREEAAMRNVTFRIAFNLDARTYKVELGDPNTLVFTDPTEREEYEEERLEKMSRFTDREVEEGKADELMGNRFEGLEGEAFREEVELPGNTFFAWVWTPQYEDPIEGAVDWAAGDEFDPEELEPGDEGPTIVYSYIFPNGHTEHTVLRIASIDDPEDGFTIEVEPMSGKVHMHTEPFDHEDSLNWVPDQAPELDL
jgi:type II secretory pathway pseudopilin PulG